MKIEILTLRQQFIVIDSSVDFQLVANPVVSYVQGVPQFPEDGNLRGTDYCSRRAGAWQINSWKLLGKQDFPLRPVFTLALVYDDTDSPVVTVQYSDINLGEGLAGLNGQLITIDPRDFAPVISAIESLTSPALLSLSSGAPVSPSRAVVRSISSDLNLSIGLVFFGSERDFLNFGRFFSVIPPTDLNSFSFCFRVCSDTTFVVSSSLLYFPKGTVLTLKFTVSIGDDGDFASSLYVYSSHCFFRESASGSLVEKFDFDNLFFLSFGTYERARESGLGGFMGHLILVDFYGNFD